MESFLPIEEQIFSFEAEIPSENSRRARALEKYYRDDPVDSKYSLPSKAACWNGQCQCRFIIHSFSVVKSYASQNL